MLNLTEKPGEYFVIGDDIRVIFVGGTANNARVMIDAPRSYNIVRGKVLEQGEEEKRETKCNQEPGERKKQKQYYIEPKISEERMKGFLEQQKNQRQSMG